MPVTTRQACPGDEQDIVALIQELAIALDYPTQIDEHYVRHYLASPVNAVLLAADEQEVVGLVSYAAIPGLFNAADSGLIEALVVTEGRRGEGIGRQLLAAAVRDLEASGCAAIAVGADAENVAAQRLYFAAGLTEASVLLERRLRR